MKTEFFFLAVLYTSVGTKRILTHIRPIIYA